MKLLKLILIAAIFAVIPTSAMAENWFMFIDTDNGWTTEDGNVTVTYTFDKNPVIFSGWTGSLNCCNPNIIAKIKNNSEDFIYLDLGKTYILRNGEAQLFQNITTMSTSKDDKEEDSTKKSLAQNVMPIPPMSTKTLTFPLFAAMERGQANGYEPFVKTAYRNTIVWPFYCKELGKNDFGKSLTYNSDNSPIVATVSLAYTNTEGAEKPIRLTKDFYVGKATFLKKSTEKEIKKAGLESDIASKNYFIIWGLCK